MAVERAVERKIVSVPFADLVGFTSLSERLDAEDVAAVQGAYLDTVRQVVGRYGGQLEKFHRRRGDGGIERSLGIPESSLGSPLFGGRRDPAA